jgi:hypothetical protein
MTPIGEILVNETIKQMEVHKRQATGQSVMSLREEVSGGSIKIFGADHWKYINEGRPAGGKASDIIFFISAWRTAKQMRYGITLPPAWAIAGKIAREGAPENKDGLAITTKVINAVRSDLSKAVRGYISKQLKIT